tara:strand:- start:9530 stop:11284 length:1755 start_codon:yes stop_codon:yes gene_type:complete
MSNFWRSGDKINLDQTEVEISAENGVNFTENNVVGIYIPPNIRFFSGKESRLSFDVELSPDTSGNFGATALMLDGTIGGQSLFSKCRIYAGNRAQLIEELDDIDTYVAVKYSYESNDSLRNKRAVTEGASVWTPECRSTTGCLKSNQSDVMSNPYFEQRFHGADKEVGAAGTGDVQTIAAKMQKAHIEMPIYMGCLANNSKAFPNILTDGLYVELTCAPARKVMRTLDTVCQHRDIFNNPLFNGAATTGTSWAADQTLIFFEKDVNMQIDAQHCPFVVGDILGAYNATGSAAVAWDAATGAPVVKNITTTANEVVIELTVATKPTAAMDPAAAEFWFYSDSLNQTGAYNPSYILSDMKMIVHRVDVGSEYENGMMAKMKSGGVISFDIPSVQCHKNSILKNDRQATINLNLEHAKCRSVISVPTDANIYEAQKSINSDGTYKYYEDSKTSWKSDSTGLTGCGNRLSSYNYSLNGMLVPSRAVPTKNSATASGGIDGEAILELEKALLGANILPLSFKDYKKNFCIGRVLAMDSNTVYDGRGVDTRLLLQYDGAAVASDVPTLWKHYVSHIKTLEIKGDGLTIIN